LLVWQTSILAPQWVVAAELIGLGIVLSLYLRNLRRIIEVRQFIANKKKQ
jgi:hypothetical protein